MYCDKILHNKSNLNRHVKTFHSSNSSTSLDTQQDESQAVNGNDVEHTPEIAFAKDPDCFVLMNTILKKYEQLVEKYNNWFTKLNTNAVQKERRSMSNSRYDDKGNEESPKKIKRYKKMDVKQLQRRQRDKEHIEESDSDKVQWLSYWS